jgi:hypothetical protein
MCAYPLHPPWTRNKATTTGNNRVTPAANTVGRVLLWVADGSPAFCSNAGKSEQRLGVEHKRRKEGNANRNGAKIFRNGKGNGVVGFFADLEWVQLGYLDFNWVRMSWFTSRRYACVRVLSFPACMLSAICASVFLLSRHRDPEPVHSGNFPWPARRVLTKRTHLPDTNVVPGYQEAGAGHA